MPPRFTYWTILLEGKPTAFRARTSEELMPTLRQLQVRHPEAVMLWFARGRLWSSPEEERAVAQARRTERERRRPDWRPGGEHRDPRDRFKVPRDEKRRRFAAKLRHDRDTGPPPEPPKDKAGGTLRSAPAFRRTQPHHGWTGPFRRARPLNRRAQPHDRRPRPRNRRTRPHDRRTRPRGRARWSRRKARAAALGQSWRHPQLE